MPNSLVIKGASADIFLGRSLIGSIEEWELTLVGNGVYTISAKTFKPDVTQWAFRDTSQSLSVVLPMKRSTQTFRVMLTSDDPFSGSASLDAHTAEGDDFW